MSSFRALITLLMLSAAVPAVADEPMPFAVVGLTHTHVHWLLGREDRGDIEIVGIVEPDRDLARRYTEQHGLSMDLVFDTMDELFEHTEPVAVTAFGSIFEHLEVVEQAAPRGIHVMVEKPLAIDMTHARRMAELARQHGIHLLTNYETTWYASTHETHRLIAAGELGQLRKMVFHHGHQGPVRIGINEEFLAWLIDPAQNGGGAIVDFGCYGANLMTWLTDGQRPLAVTAITRQLQPALYPDVDDEATVIVDYGDAQAIIQASWNWPFSRKDMEVYGERGYVIADTRSDLRVRLDEAQPAETDTLPDRSAPFDDPFAYFRAVIRGDVEMQPYDLSALENNLLVVEILDAARESAATGTTIRF